jgi:O-antigen/teichoic acid export membrane protein
MLRDLLKSGLSVILLRGVNVLLGFAVLLILTRALGPEGLGAYAYVTTLLLLVGIPVSYGWAPLLLRETSRALHDGNWVHVKGLARRGSQLAVGIATLGLGIGYAAAWLIDEDAAGWITPVAIGTLCITLLFDQLSALRNSLLRGLGKAVSGQFPEVIVKPFVQLVLLVLGIAAIGAGITLESTLIILAAATMVSYVVGTWLLYRNLPPGLASAQIQFADREWATASTLFGSSAAISLINANADMLLLGLLSEPADVGYYKVAIQVSLVGALAYTSLNMIAVQRFAAMHAAGDKCSLQATATYLARLALAPAVAVFVILMLAGESLVPLAFGAEFAPALIPMLILAGSQIINAGAGMGRSLLMMSGHENKVMVWAAIGLAANVLLCVVLIPFYGVIGASIANAASLFIWNGGVVWVAQRTTHIDTSAFGLKL